VDVVVHGYLREFGDAGARRFFLTTTGWDAPVQDDRTAPIYPRHQRLNGYERGLVDEMLAEVGARIF
ncbi:MAG: gamma-glutamylcyclotransferase, partial [Pseudomonadota bacterium]